MTGWELVLETTKHLSDEDVLRKTRGMKVMVASPGVTAKEFSKEVKELNKRDK